jgi:hypothetical protein
LAKKAYSFESFRHQDGLRAELNYFTLATFESFREAIHAIHSCPDRNYFMDYFSGHFSEDQI